MNRNGLSLKDRRNLARLIRDSKAEFVVVIGSWARRTQSPEASDLDLLIGVPSSSRCPSRNRMHVICLSSEELARRVSEGDDLAIWSLKFGIPLSGRRKWQRLRDALLPAAPWPDSSKKFHLAHRALQYAKDLADMGDREAAQEELKAGLGHLARARLLKRGVFPLSRPELHAQLSNHGIVELAAMLAECATRDLGKADIDAFVRRANEMIPQEAISA